MYLCVPVELPVLPTGCAPNDKRMRTGLVRRRTAIEARTCCRLVALSNAAVSAQAALTGVRSESTQGHQ